MTSELQSSFALTCHLPELLLLAIPAQLTGTADTLPFMHSGNLQRALALLLRRQRSALGRALLVS